MSLISHLPQEIRFAMLTFPRKFGILAIKRRREDLAVTFSDFSRKNKRPKTAKFRKDSSTTAACFRVVSAIAFFVFFYLFPLSEATDGSLSTAVWQMRSLFVAGLGLAQENSALGLYGTANSNMACLSHEGRIRHVPKLAIIATSP